MNDKFFLVGPEKKIVPGLEIALSGTDESVIGTVGLG